jgi:Mrp family chromosome partitioning ATPase
MAIHLAESFAEMGKKVLLCDIDFRNPSVARAFNLQEENGLCSILTNGESDICQVLDLVKKASVSGAPDILVPGRIPSVHPADLLAHENLKKAMSILKEHYDLIVLDASAVGQYGDILIDGLADVTCYVCRSGKTPKTALYHLNEWAESQRLASPVIIFNQK